MNESKILYISRADVESVGLSMAEITTGRPASISDLYIA